MQDRTLELQGTSAVTKASLPGAGEDDGDNGDEVLAVPRPRGRTARRQRKPRGPDVNGRNAAVVRNFDAEVCGAHPLGRRACLASRGERA